MITKPQAYAEALAAAFLADVNRPAVSDAIMQGLTGQGLYNVIIADLEREVTGEGGEELFPSLRKLLRTQVAIDTAQRGGMAQFESLLDSIIPSLTKLATTFVDGKIQAQAATAIARYQAGAQARIAASQAAAAEATRAQAAADAARGAMVTAEGVPLGAAAAARVSSQVSDFPVAPVAIGGGILVLIGLYFLMR